MVSPDFKNAVDTNDVRLVRIMLKDSMVLDPTFQEFDSLLSYAKTRLHDLYDEHDGEAFDSDSAAWDKDLLNEQMVNVVYNFSGERIAFLKKLCQKIYAQRIHTNEQQRGAAEPVRPHTAYPRAEHRQTRAKKHVGTGMLVGGAAVAIVGAVTSYPVVVAAGAVVAVAGGVVYYQNR